MSGSGRGGSVRRPDGPGAGWRGRWTVRVRVPRVAEDRRVVAATAILLGFLGLGAGAWLAAAGPTTYDAGTMAPVAATPPEEADHVNLRRGQTLGSLLVAADIGADDRVALLNAFRERANPRRLVAGTPVTYWRSRPDGELRAVQVLLSPDSSVYLRDDGDGWTSRIVRTPVRTDTVFVAGTIRSSLWMAVMGSPSLRHMPSGDRAKLLHELDKIFQWEVDFHRQVHPGDSYRVVLEREVRPDGSMRGSGRVAAAEFVNRGTSFLAFWFDAGGDGEGAYYDESGRSVQRQFLLKPLEYRRISSRVQSARFHPVLRRWRAHNGVDYAADVGVPVMATADGVVTHRGWGGSYGNLVEIRHGNGFVTRYAHLSGFGAGVVAGGRVWQGQTIGFVGMTGLATGPHLHYELRQHDQVKDPLDIRTPPGQPIPAAATARWEARLSMGRTLLDSPAFMRRRNPPTASVVAEAAESGAGPQDKQ